MHSPGRGTHIYYNNLREKKENEQRKGTQDMPFMKDETLAETIARENSKKKSTGFSKLAGKLKDTKNATRSKKLVQAVYRKRKTDPKSSLEEDPNYISGIVHFSYLAKSIEESRLDGVLNWYCSHLGEQHVPRINTPKAFRFRFADIEDAMRREARLRPELVISAAARKLFKHMGYHRVTNLRGPYSLYKTAFLNLCEITFSNADEAFNWVYNEYHFVNELPDVMDFCLTYLNEMSDWACDKYQTDEWWKYINPIDIAFRAKTKRFANAMRNWGKAVHLEQELIQDIIKGVNECVSMK